MLELIVTMITDQGQYLTLSLRQEIRTESIDPVEMTRQRIIVLKLSLMKNSGIRSSIVYSV